jgi:hypothetical protein
MGNCKRLREALQHFAIVEHFPQCTKRARPSRCSIGLCRTIQVINDRHWKYKLDFYFAMQHDAPVSSILLQG